MEQKQIVNTVLGVLAVLFFGAAIYLTMRERPPTEPSPAAPIAANDEDNNNGEENSSLQNENESALYPPGGNTSTGNSSGSSSTAASPNDVNVARESLIQYFNFLSEGEYEQAVGYHGSGWKVLQFWNRDVSANDLAGLLKAGCEKNGWHCLKIKNVSAVHMLSPVKYEFTVEFADSIHDRNSFEYFVEKVGNRFWVLTPPVI